MTSISATSVSVLMRSRSPLCSFALASAPGVAAAASVLAKTHRDELMLRLHESFPGYGWDHNKGYPTLLHRQAISQLGVTPHHRTSFRLTNEQLSLW